MSEIKIVKPILGDEKDILLVQKETWLATYPNKKYKISKTDILSKDFDSKDGILYKLFDSWFWKKEILRKIRLIKTPVIEGNWTGSLNSSSQYSTGPIDIKKFKVKQTWTRIRIYLATETSESYSFEASMTVDHFDTARIHYQYMNSPEDSSPETMHMHCGSVTAKIIDSETIEAEYYSGRDRNNTGSFSLKKCK